MIFGIGTDVVQLSRVEAAYSRHGSNLVRRLLLPEEAALFDQGVQAISIRDEVEEQQREDSGFLYLIEGFMGLGLVGEIIVHLRAPHRRAYRVRDRV